MKLTRSPAGAALAVDRARGKIPFEPGRGGLPARAAGRPAAAGPVLGGRGRTISAAFTLTRRTTPTMPTRFWASATGASWRLRLYDVNAGQIRLECKEKTGIYSHKTGRVGQPGAGGPADRRGQRVPAGWQRRRPAHLAALCPAAAPPCRADRLRAHRLGRCRWNGCASRWTSTSALPKAAPCLTRRAHAGGDSGNAVILEVKYDRFLPRLSARGAVQRLRPGHGASAIRRRTGDTVLTAAHEREDLT